VSRLGLGLVPVVLFFALPAHAHHGTASVGFAGVEGPGAAIETTAALPLPRWTGFAMVKSEFVYFAERADRTTFPQQKNFTSFNMAATGFGITPWLSGYVFQPFNVKSEDGGAGRSAGLGDTNLMAAFGWKWDERLRLIPQKESLDELMDWHFLVWGSCTIPIGPTEQNDDQGQRFVPDMQTGFGVPSMSLGLAALKQIAPSLTVLGEANYQYFFPNDYSFVRYQFGAETRVNAAAALRVYGKGRVRVDGVAELLGIDLRRDRRDVDLAGPEPMQAMVASGGKILYGSFGVRAYLGRFTVALGIRRAVLKALNEESQQQGSEGLEDYRVSLSLGTSGLLLDGNPERVPKPSRDGSPPAEPSGSSRE
jgi:hypothetical protein